MLLQSVRVKSGVLCSLAVFALNKEDLFKAETDTFSTFC